MTELSHRQLEPVDTFDLNVVAGDEIAPVGAARLPELAVDEDLPRTADDGLCADDAVRAATSGGRRRTCTALPIANAQKRPSGTVTASVSQTEVWYGAGALWKSSNMPTVRLIKPEMVSAPCVTTCASITRSATPSRISASPTHEIGSTEKPKSAVSSATAPSAPGRTIPGWKISKPMPMMPARKSSPMMFGSMSAFSTRVKKPGFAVVDVRAREVQHVGPLGVLRLVAVELDEQRRQASAR